MTPTFFTILCSYKIIKVKTFLKCTFDCLISNYLTASVTTSICCSLYIRLTQTVNCIMWQLEECNENRRGRNSARYVLNKIMRNCRRQSGLVDCDSVDIDRSKLTVRDRDGLFLIRDICVPCTE